MGTAEFFVLCIGVFMVLAGSAMLVICLKDDEKDELIDKVCDWLINHAEGYAYDETGEQAYIQTFQLVENLKKSLKKE